MLIVIVSSCAFSFSGLKTAALNCIKAHDITDDDQLKADVAASFQSALFTQIAQRTARAIRFCTDIKQWPVPALVVSGGVACNSYFRSQLEIVTSRTSTRLVVPPPRLCQDNGVMIAWAGVEYYGLGRGVALDPGQLRYSPSMPLGNDISHEVENASIPIRLKDLQ